MHDGQSFPVPRHIVLPFAVAVVACAIVGCGRSPDVASRRDRELAPYANTDSMGALPGDVHRISVHGRRDLVENSGVAASAREPGIIFTINDSGSEPLLFAVDTSGADRGAWRVGNATNTDWEAIAVGPCGLPDAIAGGGGARSCIYIGDVGDNAERRSHRVVYRVPVPTAEPHGFTGSLDAARLLYRYPDRAHNVEAMYVAPDGAIHLITKWSPSDRRRQRRPALVFTVPAAAWDSNAIATARLIDSLPIVPESAPLREITDAALSPDARYLAVRTYAQVYVFATDSLTGRVRTGVAPATCNIALTDERTGEGITWFGGTNQLLLSSEGRDSPMYLVTCPMPNR